MSDRYGYIAIEALLNFCANSKDHAVTPNDFMRMARVRVPEIVRCKDCVYFPEGTGANHDLVFPGGELKCPCECDDYWYSWKPADDWYCANGKRKEQLT